mgnify:CR=1 FL=1
MISAITTSSSTTNDLSPENESSCRDRESVQSWEKGEQHEQAEAVRSRGDHREAAGGRGAPGAGADGGQAVRRLGVSEQTYYRWRREYGGMRLDQAKRLKELERENARLKQLVAEQALDNSILREVAQGNF